jgi:hypothetical protein
MPPICNLIIANAQNQSLPLVEAALQAARAGDFENAGKLLLSAQLPWKNILESYEQPEWEMPQRHAVYKEMFEGWAAQIATVAVEGAQAHAGLAREEQGVVREELAPTSSELPNPAPIEEQNWAGGCGPGVCRPSEADMRSLQALRGAITGVSVSYAVIHFAGKAGISQAEAEAVLAYLRPTEGHRANVLLAEQAFTSFAGLKGISVNSAKTVMRNWAEGRD